MRSLEFSSPPFSEPTPTGNPPYRRRELDTAGIAGILLAGAFLQGLTGFGYSLFSLPLLLFLMPVQTAVPMLSATSIFLNLLVLLQSRHSLDTKRILPLLFAGIAGLPPGIWLLKSLHGGTLKIVVGTLVTLSAIVYSSGFRLRIGRERLAMIPVGLASGILNGATTFSGPPVILFLANQDVVKHQFRASLAAYFLLLNIASIPAFVAGGLMTGQAALKTAYLFPAVVAGSLLGIRTARRVSEPLFRRLALAALAVLGLISILNGVVT